MFDLTGKRAVVTGANTGLGAAMAVALAQAGADLVLVSRSECSETATTVEETGKSAATFRCDLRDRQQTKELLPRVIEETGDVDILVNNAGIIRRSDAADFSETDWDDVLEVNLSAVFFLSQSFARMRAENVRRGKIINIASMLSFQGGVRVASYTASKSGILGLTRLLANEWAAQNINVNAIAPGYFATNNTEALRKDEDRSRQILERIPAGRWGEPSDLAGAAVFLASGASDYVHGITLPVDGGWLAR